MKRFLLISDVHASDVDPASSKAPSYVSSYKSTSRTILDPISELERLIREEKLAPDCILCAGDVTNKSLPSPFSFAWKKLDDLAKSCGVMFITTVGNHDVDSRYKSNAYDPRGFAMSLVPRIPVPDRRHFLEYWAENFTLISNEECNLLVLNTAAYHGAGKDAAAEIEHGRISDATLAAIGETVKNIPTRPVNILLCHHHLIRPEPSDSELRGQTRGGEQLVRLLSDVDGAWIIVHGHKHIPDLFYAPGGSNAPVILGCASFSAQVNEDAQNKNPNQVHLLVCDPDGANSAGLASAGQIISWTWQPGVGWRKAQGPHGLRHSVGFGHRTSVAPLVDELERHLTSSAAGYLRWEDAVNVLPSLQRLVPADIVRLERSLDQRGLRILTDSDGSNAQVGRRA